LVCSWNPVPLRREGKGNEIERGTVESRQTRRVAQADWQNEMLPHRALWFLPALLALSFAQVNPQENLLYAAGEGDIKLVRALIAKGADVNFRSETGESPLHVAGIKCSKPVVRALIAMGADVNAATAPGKPMSMTPLHWYVNMNGCDEEAIGLLLDAGADQSLKNSQGQTPLDMVSRIKDRANIAELLRKAAAAAAAAGKGGKEEL